MYDYTIVDADWQKKGEACVRFKLFVVVHILFMSCSIPHNDSLINFTQSSTYPQSTFWIDFGTIESIIE